jgi:hypothetical protein
MNPGYSSRQRSTGGEAVVTRRAHTPASGRRITQFGTEVANDESLHNQVIAQIDSCI